MTTTACPIRWEPTEREKLEAELNFRTKWSAQGKVEMVIATLGPGIDARIAEAYERGRQDALKE